MTMTKADLKTGMWITLRNGSTFLVLLGTSDGDIGSNGGSWLDLMDYRNDLTCAPYGSDNDIVKIEKTVMRSACISKDAGKIILWERKEVKEISKDEAFHVLKQHYGCDIKITE